MPKITTNDCKLFLSDLYKDKNGENWKRIRKFKDENGYICRDFKHLDGELVTLIEKNSQLSVLLLHNSLNPSINKKEPIPTVALDRKNTPFTLFDESQQKLAKRLVNAFVKPKDEPIEPDSSSKGFSAIPNLMTFSFLEDANCDEHEYLTEIASTMQFDAPMKDIIVFFAPSTVKSLCHHISPLVEPFLSIPLEEVEEMSFRLNSENSNLTVLAVFESLCLAGFVYEPKGCALTQLFSPYKMINVSSVIVNNDKSLDFKKAFIAAVKKDDVEKVKTLIELGLPLNLKVGRTSLLGHALSENKLACFKYLVSLYGNTAELSNGQADLVWEVAWWPNDCTQYFLSSTYYNFKNANQKAHDDLVMAYGHHGMDLKRIENDVNPEYLALACLKVTFTHDRFYILFKDFVKKAIEEYPDTVSSCKELSEDLEFGFIISPILELLAGSSCLINGRSVFDVVQSEIDATGSNSRGFSDKLNQYKAFLKKHGR